MLRRVLNVLYCSSSAGSYSIEDVGKSNGDGIRFFQLYQSSDDEQAIFMLERAHTSGYQVCMLTDGTWQSVAGRHNNVDMGKYAFYHDHGSGDIGLNDEVFLERLKEANIEPNQKPKKAGAKWMNENIWHNHFTQLGEDTHGSSDNGRPFPEKAVELGVDGIMVSNHAGRQVDGANASLDALEKLVDAVGDQTVVIFDSGVRTGAYVFKALALAAKFVFIGRLRVWESSIASETGASHVMRALLAKFDMLMECFALPKIEEINRDAVDSLPRVAIMPNLPTIRAWTSDLWTIKHEV